MADARLPRSRARNLTELYLRAYWRYYATAVVWASGTTVFVFAFPPLAR